MSDGWRPLRPPRRPQAKEPVRLEHGVFAVSPFVRLARVHALGAAGDAMVAVALAGSLFFSIDPSAARVRVALYLLLTMAPFALVSRYIGPAIDRARGGRRAMIVVINIVRTLFALGMIANLDSLWLFPLAFGQLVMQKGYAVAKAAIVPTTVRSEDELVEKNARLALLSGLAGFAGAAPAALAQVIAGPELAVVLAMLTFVTATIFAFQLPRVAVAPEEEGAREKAELRASPIHLASQSMSILRAMMGFFTFLIAFAFRGGTDDLNFDGEGKRLGAEMWSRLLGRSLEGSGTSAAKLGLVVAAVVLGTLLAALIAARLRELIGEARMLEGSLVAVAVAAVLGTFVGGLSGAMLVGFVVGLGVNAGKLAFDTIVQRNAPDANYGRSFARFETRFQVVWVLGALVPVILTIPARGGYLLMFFTTAAVALLYRFGGGMPTPGEPLRVEPPARQPLTPLGSDDPTIARPFDPSEDPTLPLDPAPQRPQPREPSNQPSLWDDHR